MGCRRNRLYLSDEAVRILDASIIPTSMDAMQACWSNRTGGACAQRSNTRSPKARHSTSNCRDVAATACVLGPRNREPTRATIRCRNASPAPAGNHRRKQAEETLRVQARTDPLTGLLNRDAILHELAERLCDDSQSQVAVLYIDLDRFKVVNDVLGHGAGDELLVSAARRISQAVGTEGLIARFGGDEFLVVCTFGDDLQRPSALRE
jgi:predicted signal transduction protein with EAL and GGDEF domain